MTDAIISPYCVALIDAPSSLPSDARIAAVSRYARELERSLGAPDKVAEAFRIVSNLEGISIISAEDVAAVDAWQKAVAIARDRALSVIGDVDEAYFEVRLN